MDRSFVEVVRGSLGNSFNTFDKEGEKLLSMQWEFSAEGFGLAEQIGKPLFIEEVTLNKVHLDKGCILVLAPQNGKLNLEKRKECDRGQVSSSEDCSSWYEEDVRKSLFLDSQRTRGESSKKKLIHHVSEEERNVQVGGFKALQNSVVVYRLSKPKKVSFQARNDNERLELCVDLGPVEVDPLEERKDHRVLRLDREDREDREDRGLVTLAEEVGLSCDSMATNEEMVHGTVAVEELFGNAFSNSVDHKSGESYEEMVQFNIEVEEKFLSGNKKTSSQTDSDEALVQANFDMEMRLARGLELDIEGRKNPYPPQGSREKEKDCYMVASPEQVGQKSSSVEEEVANVIATGTALGFNFEGVEKGVVEVIARSEVEDEARFADMSEGELTELKKEVVMCNIYAANVESERKTMWNYILLAKGKLTVKIRGLNLKQISKAERSSLEEVFSIKEVWAAVCSCDGNKDSSPDGLNLNFIKENWEVIQVDFMKFIQEFHGNGEVVKDLNNTFIALISKCSNPETMRDF
ncbi:hypothetical protein Dsin_012035 [Dipteronia sinensis]|uniref:Uncharacterized protein n=1 Tax=Dipteronia sinensis TaxID=43782 RepID=A0AAE0E918_9ROSI|nr:hypothetical protein Dsin_012035 [Dipteronia sinensis]